VKVSQQIDAEKCDKVINNNNTTTTTIIITTIVIELQKNTLMSTAHIVCKVLR
jgi:hypothetical protein